MSELFRILAVEEQLGDPLLSPTLANSLEMLLVGH